MRVLQSRITRIALFIAGYLSAFAFFRSVSVTFASYMRRAFGSFLANESPLLTSFLFGICFILLLASVWQSKGVYFLRKIDWFVLLILSGYIVWLCMYFAYTHWSASELLLLLSIMMYTAFMVFVLETTARLRDKVIGKTMYVWHFFHHFPIWQPMGGMIALLIGGNLLYLLVIVPTNLFRIPAFTIFFALIALFVLGALARLLVQLSEQYERANEEKIQSERFKTELITNVSHDIRTPLTALISYVDLIKKLPVENEQFHEYMDVLERKSNRLNILIDDLMEASKASTGNVPVHLEKIDLVEIIGQIAGEMTDQLEKKQLTLVVREPEGEVLVSTDRRHLWRTLENLFGNVVKYALPGTRVFAEIFAEGGKMKFTLKNTSQLPIDLVGEKLTEQFIRGDHARSTEGSGLGLYISKSLLELMDCTLHIHTNGDLFVVEIVFPSLNN